MASETVAPRLRELPAAEVMGRKVAVAVGLRARLLGLAGLDRKEVGPGLLIPMCSSVHTFGMRFPLDIVFLDAQGEFLCAHMGVGARRFVADRRAAAVLELPAYCETL